MEQFRQWVEVASVFVLPLLLVFFPVYGMVRGVKVYEEFVTGAKEGFNTAVRIMPYLVAILFAINMFRASGAMDVLMGVCRPAMEAVGMPAELLPMVITRPLTGSGSLAILTDLVKEYGANSRIATIGATIYGSAETTFYVLAVYFGAVGIKKTRHAVAAGLSADVVAMLLAVWAVRVFLGM